MTTQHIYTTDEAPDEKQDVIKFVALSNDEPQMKLSLWLIPTCMFGAAVWAGVIWVIVRAL